MEATIYQEMVKHNIPTDSHESDLYVLKTPESEAIIRNWDYAYGVTTFVSQIDNRVWFDIPFAYSPWWESRLS